MPEKFLIINGTPGVNLKTINKKKEFSFLYPEITGYFISTMRFLYEHEKKKRSEYKSKILDIL